jgi:hypothetical protein
MKRIGMSDSGPAVSLCRARTAVSFHCIQAPHQADGHRGCARLAGLLHFPERKTCSIPGAECQCSSHNNSQLSRSAYDDINRRATLHTDWDEIWDCIEHVFCICQHDQNKAIPGCAPMHNVTSVPYALFGEYRGVSLAGRTL